MIPALALSNEYRAPKSELLFEGSLKLLLRHLEGGQKSEVNFSPRVGILELQLCGHHMQRAVEHSSALRSLQSMVRVSNGQKPSNNASSGSSIVNPHWKWGQMYEVENHILIEEVYTVSKDSHFL
jgi:hypothetical protein